MKSILKFILFVLIATTVACGSGIGTETDPIEDIDSGEGNLTTAATFEKAAVQLNAFSLGNDFPPDIQIPDIDGMRSTAFVVSFSPAGVIPVDLNSNPLEVSQEFSLFDASLITEAAFPNNVLIVSPSAAFLLASGGVIFFNPTTGVIFEKLSLTEPIELNESLAYSRPGDCDFDGIDEDHVGPGSFTPPAFSADIAMLNDRLFVTLSNACFDSSFSSFYIQGLLLIFDINNQPPYLTPAATPYLALSGFNATAITVLSDRLVVTSTGDTDLDGSNSIPETPSLLDEIDPETLKITRTLDLGKIAANFQPLAVSEDGKRGFVGSSSYGEVYEIDLESFTALRGSGNPINVNSANDFITDQEIAPGGDLLLVSSFNHDNVSAIDLTGSTREVLSMSLDFSFEANPGVTGAGPMVFRPGMPGVDFLGPDLFVLTSIPGTISTAQTY